MTNINDIVNDETTYGGNPETFTVGQLVDELLTHNQDATIVFPLCVGETITDVQFVLHSILVNDDGSITGIGVQSTD